VKVSVHLSFNGNCEEAFTTYARILAGTIVYSLRYRDSPMASSVSADWGDKLYHATMTFGGLTLMGGDHQIEYEAPRGFMVVVNPTTTEEAHRIYDALAENGTVQMAMQDTFWSPAFGMVIDRFGVPWSINYEESSAST
jgi:PhnB protein